MKIDNVFDGDIFDSNGKIPKGECAIEVSEEDGKLLIERGQAVETAEVVPVNVDPPAEVKAAAGTAEVG